MWLLLCYRGPTHRGGKSPYDWLLVKIWLNINVHTEAHLFSVPNDYLWYDKLWGPSQRVFTLLFVYECPLQLIQTIRHYFLGRQLSHCVVCKSIIFLCFEGNRNLILNRLCRRKNKSVLGVHIYFPVLTKLRWTSYRYIDCLDHSLGSLCPRQSPW